MFSNFKYYKKIQGFTSDLDLNRTHYFNELLVNMHVYTSCKAPQHILHEMPVLKMPISKQVVSTNVLFWGVMIQVFYNQYVGQIWLLRTSSSWGMKTSTNQYLLTHLLQSKFLYSGPYSFYRSKKNTCNKNSLTGLHVLSRVKMHYIHVPVVQ